MSVRIASPTNKRRRRRRNLLYIHKVRRQKAGYRLRIKTLSDIKNKRRRIRGQRLKIQYWSKDEINNMGKMLLPKSLDLDNEDYSSW